MASQETVAKKDKYKEFFRAEKEGGQEWFMCVLCDQKFKSVAGVKGHITRLHKEQVKEKVPEEETVDDYLHDVSMDEERIEQLSKEMEQAEKDVEKPAEKPAEEVDPRMIIDDEIERLGTLPEAVDRIKSLVEDVGIKEVLIKKLETELETARDLANIAAGEKESLKIENELKDKEVMKYKKLLNYQMSVNDKLKEDGADPQLVKTLKKVEDEVKAKAKALDVSEKTRKDLVKKVEEEVSRRGNLEADKERLTKIVDALNKLADQSGNAEAAKSRTKCRDVEKPGGCPRAGSCKFFHPEVVQSKDKKQIDCVHWMKGKCKFSDKDCHYKHGKEKKASKETMENKRKRSEDDGQTYEASQVDFLQGLVRTLAQGSAVEARPGSPVGPAWGVEGQRSMRPRMVSPERSAWGVEGQRRMRPRMVSSESSARGMDGHGGSSNASRPHSPRGMEDQWNQRSYYGGQEQEIRGQQWQNSARGGGSRQTSPLRELDVESLLGQLRGLEQSLQPASQVEKVQEAVQVLRRVVQQSGGRR